MAWECYHPLSRWASSQQQIDCYIKAPSYVFKMWRTQAIQPDGLSKSIIPVKVTTHNFQIKVHTTRDKYVTWSICHHQFPMTPAYAFINYWLQGQTLPYVIATPPTGGLNLFNLYVVLSWSSRRETSDYCTILMMICLKNCMILCCWLKMIGWSRGTR